jgi:hypothetical protein
MKKLLLVFILAAGVATVAAPRLAADLGGCFGAIAAQKQYYLPQWRSCQREIQV